MKSLNIVTGLMVLLTLAYAWFIWAASQIWGILIAMGQMDDVPLLPKIFIAPLDLPFWFGSIHWQLLALLSLALNLRLAKSGLNEKPVVSPLLYHACWLLFCLFLHLSGFISSQLTVAYVIR